MEFNAEEFRAKIAEVNKKLVDFGPDAVESDNTAAGFNPVGYKWQYIADAVNDVFDGWTYDLLNLDVKERGKSYYAEARLQLDIHFGGGRVTRGPTVGNSGNPNEGDAQKGAITDALKKAFSLFSIGNLAMRGELGKKSKSASKPKKATPPSDKPSDLFVAFCDKIAEAEMADSLTVVGEEIAAAYKAGKITVDENRELVARGKKRREEIANP